MTDENLKPCPFCRKTPNIQLGKTGHCQLHGDPFQYAIVKCNNKSCLVKPSIQGIEDVYNVGKEKAFSSAAKNWNNSLKPQTDAIYQCREIGESDWVDCTKERYEGLRSDPHMDTRILSRTRAQEPTGDAMEALKRISTDLKEFWLNGVSEGCEASSALNAIHSAYQEIEAALQTPAAGMIDPTKLAPVEVDIESLKRDIRSEMRIPASESFADIVDATVDFIIKQSGFKIVKG